MYTSDITLEKVDIIIERTGVTYEDAKLALEISNGDILEAIVYIERESKLSSNGIYSVADDVKKTIKDALKSGNLTRIKIKSGEKELIDIPLITGGLLAGIGSIVLPDPLVAGLIGLGTLGVVSNKITIELIKEDGSIQVVNKIIKETTEDVKNKINSSELKGKFDEATKNVKDSVEKMKKDVKSKTDEITNAVKGKGVEEQSYSVNFDDENEEEDDK